MEAAVTFETLVEASWNVMAHAQKSDFVFRRNGRVHLNRRWASVQSTAGSRGVRISGSNAGYTMFRGSVKSTGCPLLSPVSPSLPLPCVTVCHHISTGVYLSTRLYDVTSQSTVTLCDNGAIRVNISSQIQNLYKTLKNIFWGRLCFRQRAIALNCRRSSIVAKKGAHYSCNVRLSVRMNVSARMPLDGSP